MSGKHNESGVTSIFTEVLREQASRQNIMFHPFPVGGQDRHVLADQIFNQHEYFCLVEFKSGEEQLADEARKFERVMRVCSGLANENSMVVLHDRCHFIAWRDGPGGRVMSDIYRHRICNQEVLGSTCGLAQMNIDRTGEESVNKFASGFYSAPPTRALNKVDFVAYVDWLMATVTEGAKDSVSLELLARSKDMNGETIGVRLPSLRQLFDFLDASRKSAPSGGTVQPPPTNQTHGTDLRRIRDRRRRR